MEGLALLCNDRISPFVSFAVGHVHVFREVAGRPLERVVGRLRKALSWLSEI
jgi:hypothetical protein